MSKATQTKALTYLREARLSAGCASRDTAAMKVPYSGETIGRHERGEVPVAPDDVVQYAKGYKRPDIMLRYCSDCPIGRNTGRTATDRPLPFATLRVTRMIQDAQAVANRLEEIAFDGVIDDSEREDFDTAISFLRQLDGTINDMILLGMEAERKMAAPRGNGKRSSQNTYTRILSRLKRNVKPFSFQSTHPE